MSTISALPSGKFRAQIRLAHHPKQNLTFSTREEAQQWADDHECLLKGKPRADSAPVIYTLRSVWALYQQSNLFTDKKQTSRDREIDAFKAIDRLIGTVSLEVLVKYQIQVMFMAKRASESYRGKLISGNTIRIEKALMSQLFQFAELMNMTKHNPVTGQKFIVPKCNVREARISRSVEIQLYAEARKHLVDDHLAGKRRNCKVNTSGCNWLEFMFMTACRPGEASRIKLSWISDDCTKILIPVIGNKNNKPRVLLTNKVRNLPNWVKDAKDAGSGYLFYSYSENGHGQSLNSYNYDGIWKSIKPLVEGLEKDVTPHVIRHECISRLVESTSLNMPEIAQLVGMKSYESLKPYIHLRIDGIIPRNDEHRSAESRRLNEDPEMKKQYDKALLADALDQDRLNQILLYNDLIEEDSFLLGEE
jgi:integrase